MTAQQRPPRAAFMIDRVGASSSRRSTRPAGRVLAAAANDLGMDVLAPDVSLYSGSAQQYSLAAAQARGSSRHFGSRGNVAVSQSHIRQAQPKGQQTGIPRGQLSTRLVDHPFDSQSGLPGQRLHFGNSEAERESPSFTGGAEAVEGKTI